MAHELAPLSTSLPATRAHYVIKRDFWSFFERTFRVFADDGRLVMLIRRPLFRPSNGVNKKTNNKLNKNTPIYALFFIATYMALLLPI